MSQIYKQSSGGSSPSLANVVFPLSYPYTVPNGLPNNSFIVVDTNESRTIFLPSSPVQGESFRFKDGDGLSNANPIIVEGNGNTIDGSSQYVISFTYGFVGVLFNGSQWNVSNN